MYIIKVERSSWASFVIRIHSSTNVVRAWFNTQLSSELYAFLCHNSSVIKYRHQAHWQSPWGRKVLAGRKARHRCLVFRVYAPLFTREENRIRQWTASYQGRYEIFRQYPWAVRRRRRPYSVSRRFRALPVGPIQLLHYPKIGAEVFSIRLAQPTVLLRGAHESSLVPRGSRVWTIDIDTSGERTFASHCVLFHFLQRISFLESENLHTPWNYRVVQFHMLYRESTGIAMGTLNISRYPKVTTTLASSRAISIVVMLQMGEFCQNSGRTHYEYEHEWVVAIRPGGTAKTLRK